MVKICARKKIIYTCKIRSPHNKKLKYYRVSIVFDNYKFWFLNYKYETNTVEIYQTKSVKIKEFDDLDMTWENIPVASLTNMD